MKMIVAMIQTHKLTDVKQALFDAQVYKMTVTNALGAGEQARKQSARLSPLMC